MARDVITAPERLLEDTRVERVEVRRLEREDARRALATSRSSRDRHRVGHVLDDMEHRGEVDAARRTASQVSARSQCAL